MLNEINELQNNAVRQLIEKSSELDDITFKSPTGSGKTHMMASMMSQMLAKDDNLIFLVSSLSKGGLAEQNYEAFQSYKSEGKFTNVKPYLINTELFGEERLSIPIGYNVYVLPRDLYKNGGKLMQGAMEGFLKKITGDSLFGGLEKHIYLVKDECHVATNNLDNLSSTYFEKIFNFSATPKLSKGKYPTVEIKKEDAESVGLIKRVVWGDENETLDSVLKKYCEIKSKYIDTFGIVPCIIIQISNKDEAEQEWNNIIKPALEKNHIQWMYYVDDKKKCMTNHKEYVGKPDLLKKYAKKDTSTIEAIVFKLAITEGWDIRRACMLYQIRSTKSKQLDEQVLGRIRRNPILKCFENYDADDQAFATTAWAWGIKNSSEKTIIPVEISNPSVQNDLKIKTTILDDLIGCKKLDIRKYICKKSLTQKSIFQLYRDYENSNEDIKKICRDNINTIQDWLAFTSNISEIKKEYGAQICDYDKNMKLKTDEKDNPIQVSIPSKSYYFDTEAYVPLTNHMWKRQDGKDDFAYDSEAEKEFATILYHFSVSIAKEIPSTPAAISMWGKNYLPNSEIKFEYYLDGTHFSYPDFILKDKYERVHLFEVKSLNVSGSISSLDSEAYKAKIAALKKCYVYASKLTGHIFYLPIKEDRSWKIIRLMNGAEDNLTQQQLLDYLQKTP